MADIWGDDFYISLWKRQRTIVKLSSFTEHSALGGTPRLSEKSFDFVPNSANFRPKNLVPLALCCESKTRHLWGQLVARLSKFLEVKSRCLKVSFPLKGLLSIFFKLCLSIFVLLQCIFNNYWNSVRQNKFVQSAKY